MVVSHLRYHSSARCGIIILEENSRFFKGVSCSSLQTRRSAIFSEIQALLMGIHLGKKMSENQIIVKSDYVQLVNMKPLHTSRYYRNFIFSCNFTC